MLRPFEFEWDEDKAALNFVSHHVAFPFAAAVFLDENRIEFDVSRPSDGEERRKTIGSIGRRLFSVVFTLSDGTTRMISARRTNRSEDRLYAQGEVHP